MYKRIAAAIALCLGLSLAPFSVGTASADTGKGGFCETIITRSQKHTIIQGQLVFDQWHYNAGSGHCWQIHRSNGRRMSALVEITKTNERTGAKTVTTKQFSGKAYAFWGCHKTTNTLVDVEVWIETDGDGQFDDGYIIVLLNAN